MYRLTMTRSALAVLALMNVLACASRDPASVAPALPPSASPAPDLIKPTEASRSSGPCSGLDYCACEADARCSPRLTEGCVCPCDFRCRADQLGCMCACGGARFAACESKGEPLR